MFLFVVCVLLAVSNAGLVFYIRQQQRENRADIQSLVSAALNGHGVPYVATVTPQSQPKPERDYFPDDEGLERIPIFD